MTQMVYIDAWEHNIAIYREFMKVFRKTIVETFLPHQSIDDSTVLGPGHNLLYGWIAIEQSWIEETLQLSQIESGYIHAIT
jgi:hypothetical protein